MTPNERLQYSHIQSLMERLRTNQYGMVQVCPYVPASTDAFCVLCGGVGHLVKDCPWQDDTNQYNMVQGGTK